MSPQTMPHCESLPDQRSDLIAEYCARAGELLEHAHSLDEAVAIRDSVCEQFARVCESGLVRNATRQYIDNVIEEKWGSDAGPGKNDSH